MTVIAKMHKSLDLWLPDQNLYYISTFVGPASTLDSQNRQRTFQLIPQISASFLFSSSPLFKSWLLHDMASDL